MNGDERLELIADLISVPIRLFSHKPILSIAFEMAVEHNLTVYDALYLALAEEHGAELFTADKRLLDVAQLLNLSG